MFVDSDTTMTVITSWPAAQCFPERQLLSNAALACGLPLSNEGMRNLRDWINARAMSQRCINQVQVMPNDFLEHQIEGMYAAVADPDVALRFVEGVPRVDVGHVSSARTATRRATTSPIRSAGRSSRRDSSSAFRTSRYTRACRSPASTSRTTSPPTSGPSRRCTPRRTSSSTTRRSTRAPAGRRRPRLLADAHRDGPVQRHGEEPDRREHADPVAHRQRHHPGPGRHEDAGYAAQRVRRDGLRVEPGDEGHQPGAALHREAAQVPRAKQHRLGDRLRPLREPAVADHDVQELHDHAAVPGDVQLPGPHRRHQGADLRPQRREDLPRRSDADALQGRARAPSRCYKRELDNEIGPNRWAVKPPLGPRTPEEFFAHAKHARARGFPARAPAGSGRADDHLDRLAWVAIAVSLAVAPACSSGSAGGASADGSAGDGGVEEDVDAAAPDAAPTYAPTFTAVYGEIFVPICAGPFCHASAADDFLSMATRDEAYSSLVGVRLARSGLRRAPDSSSSIPEPRR